jgi:hypothetical protein
LKYIGMAEVLMFSATGELSELWLTGVNRPRSAIADCNPDQPRDKNGLSQACIDDASAIRGVIGCRDYDSKFLGA